MDTNYVKIWRTCILIVFRIRTALVSSKWIRCMECQIMIYTLNLILETIKLWSLDPYNSGIRQQFRGLIFSSVFLSNHMISRDFEKIVRNIKADHVSENQVLVLNMDSYWLWNFDYFTEKKCWLRPIWSVEAFIPMSIVKDWTRVLKEKLKSSANIGGTYYTLITQNIPTSSLA